MKWRPISGQLFARLRFCSYILIGATRMAEIVLPDDWMQDEYGFSRRRKEGNVGNEEEGPYVDAPMQTGTINPF